MAKDENISLDLPLFQAPVIKEPIVTEVDTKESSREDRKSGTRAKKGSTQKGDPKGGSGKVSDKTSENIDQANEKSRKKGKASDQDTNDASGDSEPPTRKRVRNRDSARENRKERASSSDSGSTRTSTRVDSKKRRKDSREIVRRRNAISEANFLAARDDVVRRMIVRDIDGSQQISILEDDILVEHYVSEQSDASVVGNVYLGRVQNVLPGMEAAFLDIGVGRNGVLYAGEVNWDGSGLVDGDPKRIEQVLKKGDTVMVQVTKDPIGQKGARLTSQVTLPGRFLVLVPSGGVSGISKRISDKERARLKRIVSENSDQDMGMIIRTAASGVSEEELVKDIENLKSKWKAIEAASEKSKAPAELYGESNMARRVIRENFNESFAEMIISGDEMFEKVNAYLKETTPELAERVKKWDKPRKDIFDSLRIKEQLAKSFDRKVWLPSGGTLVIDRTEAMTVIDINTGKFTGSKSDTLEDTVTQNNLEAAEEIVRQLRLRDIGGIVVIDFIDMILEDNREKVLRRLIECLMRDRTKHQVAEVTSLGLVQLTRKRVGQGLIEAFSTTCEMCNGKGYVIHPEPVKKDINSAIVPETDESWGDAMMGASHELADGSTIAELDDIAEEKREENKKRFADMAKAAGVDLP
jgi:ribonuclease E